MGIVHSEQIGRVDIWQGMAGRKTFNPKRVVNIPRLSLWKLDLIGQIGIICSTMMGEEVEPTTESTRKSCRWSRCVRGALNITKRTSVESIHMPACCS